MTTYNIYKLFTIKEYSELTNIDNIFENDYFSCSFRKNHTNGITFYFNSKTKIFVNFENKDYRLSEDRRYIAGYDGKYIYVGIIDNN